MWISFMTGLMSGRRPMMIFDWDEAASLIVDRGAETVVAGLSGDWERTSCFILRDGLPVTDHDRRPCLGSVWASPQILIGSELIDCWRHEDEVPGWDEHTVWPESARAILDGGCQMRLAS